MDPISIIVTALAAGAVSAIKPTAQKAIKDAYTAMKAVIQRKYQTLSIETLEHKPHSEAERASLVKGLTAIGAQGDQELLDLARQLLDTIKTHDRAAATTLNIDFEQIEAAYFKLKDAAADGSVNVGIRRAKFSGGIDMEGLAAGMPPKKS